VQPFIFFLALRQKLPVPAVLLNGLLMLLLPLIAHVCACADVLQNWTCPGSSSSSSSGTRTRSSSSSSRHVAVPYHCTTLTKQQAVGMGNLLQTAMVS
jgi:hypothetical protein